MLLGLFAATLAALMPYVWFVHAPRFIKSSTEAAFFGRLQEYVDLARDRSKPIDPKIAGQPRRAFKIVVIDLEENGPRIRPLMTSCRRKSGPPRPMKSVRWR